MELCMTKKPTNDREASGEVLARSDRHGRETWRVTLNGEIKSISTRSSSTKAMDEAVIIYSNALRRLADR
jgi:hypothetical protein